MKALASLAPGALLLAVTFAPTAAWAADDPSDLAKKARAVLEANCYRCHGKDGKAEEGVFVLNRERLVARNKITPGKATKSVLYNQVASEDMPPSGESPRPGKDDVEVLRRWIDAGAPSFAQAVATRTFLSTEGELKAVKDDLAKLREQDQRFARYFTITHLYNAGLPDDDLQSYRNGLSKLVNSLSWDRGVKKPEPIDAAQTVFRIDLRDYKWNEKTWLAVLDCNPYGLIHDSVNAKAIYAATDCPLPYVRGDWFVFAASRPPLYHDVLGMPETAHDLETLLRVDVNEELRQEKHVARAGFNGSGVSDNNRIIERHETGFGAYWRSFDFAESTGRRNIFDHPLGPLGDNGFQPDGGEIIFNLPNHLQAYMLVNKDGKRIDKGPTTIVHDDKQRDRAVTNGISCMSCHAQGIIPKTDQIRKAVEEAGGFTSKELDHVRALYPADDVFTALLQEDAGRYQKALEETGDHVQKADTLVQLAARFEEELDLKEAAAEAGMKPDEFLQGLRRSPKLDRILGPLTTEGGTVKRDVFTQAFGDLVRDLGLGKVLPSGGGAAPQEVVAARPPDVVAPPPPDAVGDKEKIVTNSLGMRLVRIEPGTFTMGSPKGEGGRFDDEGPQHKVEITKPFYMGGFPVTKGQFARFIKEDGYHTEAEKAGDKKTWRNPAFDKYVQTDDDPVVYVTWNDAVKFCEWLSRKEKKTYTLPTEAQWEYACRAGTTTAYSFGDDPKAIDDYAWYMSDSGGHTHPVGGKKPNPWGLYDMHGNVWQWCADDYGPYQEGALKDPQGVAKADARLARGGCWTAYPKYGRSAYRARFAPGNRYDVVGLRVCLPVD